MKIISQAALHEMFEYAASTGEFYWKAKDRSHFKSNAAFSSFNSRCLGRAAGYVNPLGYRIIRIDRRGYFAHRLAWIYINGDGTLPIGYQIDHIDHNKSNNRIENLRIVTHCENQKNRSIPKSNKSGCIGVRRMKNNGMWRASILGGGFTKYLGEYSNIDDAIKARKTAELDLGFHHNHGKPIQLGSAIAREFPGVSG